MSEKRRTASPDQRDPREGPLSRTTALSVTPGPSGGHADEWRDLGRDAFLSGETSEALRYLRRAVETDPDDPEAWHILGLCFEVLGAEPRAERCFALAARLTARVGESRGRTTSALRWKGIRGA